MPVRGRHRLLLPRLQTVAFAAQLLDLRLLVFDRLSQVFNRPMGFL